MTLQVPTSTRGDQLGPTAHTGLCTRTGNTHNLPAAPGHMQSETRGGGGEAVGRGPAPLQSHYLSGKGEGSSRGEAHGQLPRRELPGRLVGEVSRLAGDHAEEQGEEGRQPRLGQQDGQTDDAQRKTEEGDVRGQSAAESSEVGGEAWPGPPLQRPGAGRSWGHLGFRDPRNPNPTTVLVGMQGVCWVQPGAELLWPQESAFTRGD